MPSNPEENPVEPTPQSQPDPEQAPFGKDLLPNDPTKRVTQEELTGGSLAPANIVDPLGPDKKVYPFGSPDGSITKPDIPSKPGALQQNPANSPGSKALKKPPIKKPGAAGISGDPVNAGIDSLKGKLGDGKVGKMADDAAEAAKVAIALARAASGDLTQLWKNRGAIKDLLKKYWPALLAIVLLAELPLLILAIAIGSSLGGQGKQQLGVAVGASGAYTGASCSEMQPTLDINYNGKPTHLFVSSTTGKFSEEDAIDINNGHVITKPSTGAESSDTVSYWDNLPAQDKTAEAVKWYITARWPGWSTAYSGATNHTAKGFPGTPPFDAFAGKKAIIFNPKNGKAVLGIIEEFGPAPWTGIQENKDDPPNAQSALWATLPGSANGYRIYDPVGYTGRVAGGPVTLEKALGTDNQSDIQFGFAPAAWQQSGDTHQLGPLQCTIVNHTSSGGAGGVIAVPTITEADNGTCGNASIAAVILKYNPSYTNSSLLSKDASGKYTTTETSCGLKPQDISSATHGSATDFTYAAVGTGTGEVSSQDVITSLQNGDPVIMYSAPDAIYPGGNPNQRVFVLTGYDSTASTFDVMSPNTTAKGGPKSFVGVNSKGTALNWAALTAATGNLSTAYPGHPSQPFIIRAKWISAK